jgi:hypothetical protein
VPRNEVRRVEVAHITGEGREGQKLRASRNIPSAPPLPVAGQTVRIKTPEGEKLVKLTEEQAAQLREQIKSGALKPSGGEAPRPSGGLSDIPGFDPVRGTYMGKKIGRNDPCPCGSGKKYKRCHGLSGDGSGS